MKFKEMTPSERPYLIISNDVRPCEICGDMTEFLDEYGVRLCSEECVEAMDRIDYENEMMKDTLDCGCCSCCGCTCRDDEDEDFEE